MSLQARAALVNSPNTIFQRNSQREDLLDENLTRTELIALLWGLVAKGHILLFTAVRSDHHDDSCLGFHSHADGFCADVWFQTARDPNAYAESDSPDMVHGLADAARSPWLYQVGLAGSAITMKDALAAGRTEFDDGGADHIHLGASG
jgi:hypothetical protein